MRLPHSRVGPVWTVLVCVALLLMARPASAQIKATLVASGVTNPVAFIQDPVDPTVQYIVELGGHVHVLMGGQMQDQDFVDLSPFIAIGAESGVFGMAFSPDYAVTRRVFFNFKTTDGTVIARFNTTTDDPPQVDLSTRLDLAWADGNRFIVQPIGDHNGGDLQFGDDGYLYIALGDGGGVGDPFNYAQNPASPLGKVLRIDTGVDNSNTRGYVVPADNPFVGNSEVLAEIWSFGFRNPWRYSFDSQSRGGTGALIIADVGESAWEEFNYEPAGAGGRNYGWRNREGANDYDNSIAPYTLTAHRSDLRIFPFARQLSDYRRIRLYRGSALPAQYQGRYFFGDFIKNHIWSAGLSD